MVKPRTTFIRHEALIIQEENQNGNQNTRTDPTANTDPTTRNTW
jgi:hypothetical protein